MKLEINNNNNKKTTGFCFSLKRPEKKENNVTMQSEERKIILF